MRFSLNIILIVLVFLTTNVRSQVIILDEDFTVLDDMVIGGQGWAFTEEVYYNSPSKSISVGATKSYTYLSSNVLAIPSSPSSVEIYLEFSQICKTRVGGTSNLQYQINSGGWLNFVQADYFGTGIYSGIEGFDANSYGALWDVSNPMSMDNSWWKNERFKIPGATATDNVQIRFQTIDLEVAAADYYGWLIDDVKIQIEEVIDPCAISFTLNDEMCVNSELSIGGLILPSGVLASDVEWSVDGSPIGTGLTPPDYVFATPGTYTVEVAIVGGTTCLGASASIGPIDIVNPNSNTITVTPTANCGQYVYSVTGGSYTNSMWSFGDGYFALGETTTHTYTTNGTYTISFDADGITCPLTEVVVVTVLPDADFSYVIDDCNVTTPIELTIANYDNTLAYIWEINGTPVPSIGATGPYPLAPLVVGNNVVKLIVIGAGNCQAEVSKIISIGGIIPDFVFNINDVACLNDLLPLIEVSPGGNTYNWTITPPSGAANNILESSQYPQLILSEIGAYTCSLSVAINGCPDATYTDIVTVSADPDFTFTTTPGASCGETDITLVGTPTYTDYLINYDDGTIVDATGVIPASALNHTYTSNGLFTISITLTNNNCTTTYQQITQNNDQASVVIAGNIQLCTGATAPLTAVLQNVTGTGSVSYEWIETSTPATILGTSASYTAVTPGTYQVTVTPTSGGICFATSNNQATIVITELVKPLFTVNSSTLASCLTGTGGSAEIEIVPNPSQGYTINGSTTVNTTTPITIPNLIQGTNYITLANASNQNCASTTIINIASDNMVVQSTSTTPASCANGDGDISITISGGVSNYTYNLYTVNNYPSTIQSTTNKPGVSHTFSNVSAGSYIVEIVDNNGCSTTQNVTVLGTTISLTLQNNYLNFCSDGSGNVTAQAIVTPGTVTPVYTWEIWNTTTQSWVTESSTTSQQTITQTGSYRVTAVESSCSATHQFTVGNFSPLAVNLYSDGQQCSAEDVTITANPTGGSGSYTIYDWSPNVTPNGAQATLTAPSTDQTVTLTVTDNMCGTDLASILVYAKGDLLLATGLAGDPLIIAPPYDDRINITGCSFTTGATGGTAPYVFNWYLENQDVTSTETIEFNYDGSTLTYVSDGSTVDVSGVAISTGLSDAITEFGLNGGPVHFQVDESDCVYPYWIYDGVTNGYYPSVQNYVYKPYDPSDVFEPYSITVTTTTQESMLQHSHSQNTTLTSYFVTGIYTLILTDSEGCMVTYTGIDITIPEPETNFPAFSFVWVKDKITPPEPPEPEKDENLIENMAEASAEMFSSSQKCLQQQSRSILSGFRNDCFNLAALQDEFSITYNENIYNYTLFYYDRAGALTKTVSPEGVDILSNTDVLDVIDYREGDKVFSQVSQYLQDNLLLPDHNLETKYRYNGIGQLINQETPDGGISNFIYDSKSRLRFSQNQEQALAGDYSYTRYDALGRVIEAGQANETGLTFDETTDNSLLADNMNFPVAGTQITRSVYTTPAQVNYYSKEQRFLQNRISYVYSDYDGDINTLEDQYYTYYSYDPHGNVEWLIQQDPELGQNYIAYEYDLISGNVLQVKYNEHRDDKFFHKYTYDAENRLNAAFTSTDGRLWDNDASYAYYDHGPLKRTEIGEDHVQGTDNVYTIHGWLKSVNTPHLDVAADPGLDGQEVVNSWETTNSAEDVFGMSLGYYNGDYVRTAGSFHNKYDDLYASLDVAAPTDDKANLFNGNISHWVNSRLYNNGGNIEKTAYTNASVYRYDALNRIKQSVNYEASNTILAGATPIFTSEYNGNANADSYKTGYTYDANGNLLDLNRNDQTGTAMDDIGYNYDYTGGRLTSNQLRSITESVGTLNGNGDIAGGHTYTYDEIGNLITEVAYESMDLDGDATYSLYEITTDLTWNVSGKVKAIHKKTRDNAGALLYRIEDIEFEYDPMGNRIKKKSKLYEEIDADGITDPNNISYNLDDIKTTYYVLDATGNPMSIYEKTAVYNSTDDDFDIYMNLKEQAIYGSSRIGQSTREVNISLIEDVPTGGIQLPEFDPISSGIQKISEYQNWITSANKTTPIGSSGLEQLCQCKIKTLGNNSAQTDYESGTPEDLTQFLGVAENGIAIAEDLLGETQFYVTLVQKYLGNNDACLIYDKAGNLMKGIELIETVDVKSKPVVVNLTGTHKYGVITRTLSGKPTYHIIDMDELGYGGVTASGEVIQANISLTSMPPQTTYGWHYTGYEDHLNQRTIVYASRYTPSTINPNEGTTEIVALELDPTNNTLPQEHIVYSIDGCGDTYMGEIQISPNGQKLLWYQHDKNISGFDYRNVNIYAIELGQDKITSTGNIDIINTGTAGNVGKGSAEFMENSDDVLYGQRGIYQDPVSGTEKNVWKYEKITPQTLLSINPITPTNVFLFSEIKRGADGNYYMPNKAEQVDDMHSYTTGNTESVTLQAFYSDPDNVDYQYASSLPTQVYKTFDPRGPEILFTREIGKKVYELTDHLGNVRVVITDQKIVVDVNTNNIIDAGDYFTPNMVTFSDYYPFGMLMPGRHANSESYRYGAGGMEMDNEVAGTGNSYTTEFRQLDPRLGRWKSLDPLMGQFPHQSGYTAFDNNPIYYNDPKGLSAGGGNPDDFLETGDEDGTSPPSVRNTNVLPAVIQNLFLFTHGNFNENREVSKYLRQYMTTLDDNTGIGVKGSGVNPLADHHSIIFNNGAGAFTLRMTVNIGANGEIGTSMNYNSGGGWPVDQEAIVFAQVLALHNNLVNLAETYNNNPTTNNLFAFYMFKNAIVGPAGAPPGAANLVPAGFSYQADAFFNRISDELVGNAHNIEVRAISPAAGVPIPPRVGATVLQRNNYTTAVHNATRGIMSIHNGDGVRLNNAFLIGIGRADLDGMSGNGDQSYMKSNAGGGPNGNITVHSAYQIRRSRLP